MVAPKPEHRPKGPFPDSAPKYVEGAFGHGGLNLEDEEQHYTDPETGVVTMVWRPVPPDDRRCRARITSSKSPWRGNQCSSWALKGAPVCKFHGGSLPSVKRAAQQRLVMAAIPAAERLIHMAIHKKGMSDSDRLKAIGMILDRAGIEGKSTIQIEVEPWKEVLQQVYGITAGPKTDDDGMIDLEEGVDYEVEGIDYAAQDKDDGEKG